MTKWFVIYLKVARSSNQYSAVCIFASYKTFLVNLQARKIFFYYPLALTKKLNFSAWQQAFKKSSKNNKSQKRR